MPTLRRSKSLNDKISRQKNRAGDVVRDPRSPDVEGRTRTCVDNFQALVHLRKQTEDKARQLELAFSYATNGHTYLRRGPSGGVELPYPTTTNTTTTTTIGKTPRTTPTDPPDAKPPVPRRQHSAEGRSGTASLLRRQESSDTPPPHPQSSSSSSSASSQHQSRREQRRGQRPMSMVEPRVGSLFPTQEELQRKDQVIQNLTESQRGLNAHNQQLLSKVDELEFENHRLRELLNGFHNNAESGGTPGSAPYPNSTRPHRSISLHGEALRVSSGSHAPASTHALVSPHSETSVSGYGSLADSPSGDGFLMGGEARAGVVVVPRTAGSGMVLGEEDDDDTMPLSGVSECSLEYRNDTLEKTSSSASTESSSRASRAATMNSDRSERDWSSGGGGGRGSSKGIRPGTRNGKEEDGDGNPRIEELAKQVAELSSQRDTVLLRYKQLVQENLRLLKRDKRIQEELGVLLDKQGHSLHEDLRSELQILQEQLRDLSEDVQVEVQRVLTALDSFSPAPGSRNSLPDPMDAQVGNMMDRLVDLIGPDYQRLGRRLTVPQQELDRLEKKAQEATVAHKTRAMLKTWLTRRGGAGSQGMEVPPAAQHLVQALRDVDKDVQHCRQSTVSGPERQALRNCLALALDHVTDPRDVLDHLIALNELTPASIAFVQEVLEKRDRAVGRLWHVSEYRGTGMVSRLALALDRSHCGSLAHRLREELEIQNSRIHSQSHPPSEEPPPITSPPPPSTTTTPLVEPQAVASQARSRPMSRVPRLRSKTFDSSPVTSPPPGQGQDSAVSAPQRDRPAPHRQTSVPEKGGLPPRKERPTSAVLNTTGERSAPALRKISRQSSQHDRRSLPVARERSFSPSQKDKPVPAHLRDKPGPHLHKERALSPLVKDNNQRPDPAAKPDKPVLYSSQKEKTFSPFGKDRVSRPFSPLDKDKAARPFSPLEKDRVSRPFSPEKPARSSSPYDRQKLAAAAAQHGRGGGPPIQRPFSPLQKDKTAASFQKERAVTPSQRDRGNGTPQSGVQAPAPVDQRPAPQPSKETQAIWDRRAAPGSAVDTTPATRTSVVLEQGGKISRV